MECFAQCLKAIQSSRPQPPLSCHTGLPRKQSARCWEALGQRDGLLLLVGFRICFPIHLPQPRWQHLSGPQRQHVTVFACPPDGLHAIMQESGLKRNGRGGCYDCRFSKHHLNPRHRNPYPSLQTPSKGVAYRQQLTARKASNTYLHYGFRHWLSNYEWPAARGLCNTPRLPSSAPAQY